LAAPRGRYADFVAWQAAEQQRAPRAQAIAWWTQRLAGLPRLDLPECQSTPAPSHAGHHCRLHISAELSAQAKQLARREGCTLFQVLLAAWACVLHRHAGQDDFAVGTLMAGRDQAEFADIVGFFVNTVVLRCDLSGEPTFRALLLRARTAVVEALQHQDVPFDAVVQAVGATRGQDLTPLIQVSFDLIAGAATETTAGTVWTRLDGVRGDGGADGTAKFNLGLALIDDPGGLHGTLEYATDLYDHAAVERIARHFEVVLAAAVAAADTPIGRLPVMTDDERGQLAAGNRTDRAVPDHCIHDAIAMRARRSPAATAVDFLGQRLSYGELDQRANQLAHALRAIGVTTEARVGLCVERSLDMVVALLAILKAGGAYVPLDPSYPVDRLTFMLDDAHMFALVTTAAIATRWPDHPVRVLRLDADAEVIARQPTAPLELAVSPDRLAYVIYTSGSTGRPKGVEIEHRALHNTLAHFARQIEVTADDTLLAVTSLSFDIAALELFMPLLQGAAVRLMSRDQTLDGTLLAREVAHATILQATPATWQLLLEAGWTGHPRLRAMCGGEALSWPLACQLLDRASVVWNCYGPTETTVWSTAWRVERRAGRALLGKPIANTRLYVLDGRGEPVPVGVPGELYIGGTSCARGYLDRAELTAQRFVADPWSAAGRMYRTGDKVRWTAGGDLEFLGRFDHQVKLRGFRIELGEIEAVLAQHPGVRACAVVVRGGDDGRLIAYYVASGRTGGADDDRDVPSGALRDHLARSLPAYMLPATFVRLDELPLTPNQKIDRKALPEPAAVPEPEARAAPASELARALADVWRELLRVEPDPRRTFFEQGGTSLQLVRLQLRTRERLAIEVSVAELMAYPTIEALARRIEQRSAPAPSGAELRRAEPAAPSEDRRLEIEGLSDGELSATLRGRLERLRRERQSP
ncbi:MAG TPA: amino acid adenylation domain-containing protein, partial [Kofleriaceae bacterium]|nr:amino acid adenylation domain-containing protein [Kofleriaceae bacterium]